MVRSLVFVAVAAALSLPAQRIEFNRDIRPILSDKCPKGGPAISWQIAYEETSKPTVAGLAPSFSA